MFTCLTRPAVSLNLLFAVALTSLVWAAYSPSLRHAPRADQWCFLVDTIDDHTFLDTLRHSYSYNRTRQTAPGDTDLFRPLLFALLAAEKVWLGGDLGAHQVVGIALHLAVCILLLALLRTLGRTDRAGPLPYAVTTFFALNPAIQELVIWSHLNGYILFLVFLLGSLQLLLRFAANTSTGSVRSPSLWGSWLLALLAAFTYEMGQVYAVMAGLFLAAVLWPKVGLVRSTGLFALFASILVTFQVVNAIDLRVHEGEYTPDNAGAQLRDQVFTRATLTHSARFAVFTAVQPFAPSLQRAVYSNGRLLIFETLWAKPSLKTFGPAALVSAAVLLAGLALGSAGVRGLLRRRERLPLLAFALTTGLYAVYAGIAVLGRMNLRPGPYILASNCYYAYPALLFLLMAAFAAWHAVGDGLWAARLRNGLCIGLVALALLGAEQVRRVNEEVARGVTDITKPVRPLEQFARQHRREPDFGFAIEYEQSDPMTRVYGIPIDRVIYAKWTTPDPKYRVAIRDGKVLVLARRD